MIDQCKHCVKRGKYEECIKNECDQMETWIIQHLLLLVDIEHRRRVAAEKTILEMRSLWVKDIDFEMGYNYKKWQSIIKEAGE